MVWGFDGEIAGNCQKGGEGNDETYQLDVPA